MIRLLELANAGCMSTFVTGRFSSHGAHSYAKQRFFPERKMCGACVACRVNPCPVSCVRACVLVCVLSVRKW